MEIHRLIKLANNIGAFFEAEPDKSKGAQGVATHIKSFWDPRMRREILDYLDSQHGAGLSGLVLSALRSHREELVPQPRSGGPYPDPG
jgi:formate dehydrogenase subunit delta